MRTETVNKVMLTRNELRAAILRFIAQEMAAGAPTPPDGAFVWVTNEQAVEVTW